MYSSIYIYRVPEQNVERFLEIQRDVAEIYKERGAVDEVLYQPSTLTAKYGCTSFDTALADTENKSVFVSVSQFRDREHHDAVMEAVDADERINDLFEEISAILDVSQVIRGEFECAI